MENKKNIDRLFQEKFKDFEAAPNDAVWNRISESLPNKKKKRRVVALWWQIGGVAAVIALLLTVGISVFNNDGGNGETLPIVNIEDTNSNDTKDNTTDTSIEDKQNELNKNTIDKLEFVGSETDEKSILDETENNNSNTPKKAKISNPLTTSNKTRSNAVVNNSNKNIKSSQKFNNLNTVINKETMTKVVENTTNKDATEKQTDKSQLNSEDKLKSEIKKTIEDNTTATVDNTTSKKTESASNKTKSSELNNTNSTAVDTDLIEDPKKESITEAIANNTTETIDEKEDKKNRWSILPNVAPVYYSSLGQGSSIDQQFNENSKSGDINMSYGISGSYAVSKKLKIRAGINQVNLSQSTSDVFAFSSPTTAVASTTSRSASPKYGNINLNTDAQSISLMSAKAMVASSNFSNVGSMDQRIGFIEIPLELEYRVLDKKFGINVIGGFSTFFLNQNEIYADIEGASTLIGEANNINSTSYSANFGLGLDYSLSKQWNINLEPQFKYQLNTFNNTSGDFRPFFIGVYTGLSFKF